jgi:hypothetical protein
MSTTWLCLRPTLVVVALASCYHSALVPNARASYPRIIVLEAREPFFSRLGARRVVDDSDGEGAGHGYTPRRSFAVLVAQQLNAMGWKSVAGDPRLHSSGALLSDAWPAEICDEAILADASAVVLIAFAPTWERSAAGGIAELDVTAHMVGCPANVLLWRDRAIGRLGTSVIGHSRLGVDTAKLDQMRQDLAIELTKSLREESDRTSE